MCTSLDYSSPASIKNFLKNSNFAMQKKWGQNFLVDAKMRENIMEMLGDIDGKNIWEIGAGLGAMTHLLAKKNVKLTLFEIDAGFLFFLKQIFESKVRNTHSAFIRIIEGDVLKTWKNEVKKNGMPDVFFGCLPYNISIALLLSLFKELAIFDKILVTVQREVAQKMIARENKKEYSPLSVFTNYFYECSMMRDIPPSCFWPQPSVISTAILLKKKEKRELEDESFFFQLVSSLFSSRRRTLKNNLNEMLKQQKLLTTSFYSSFNSTEDFFDLLNLDPFIRAENLRVEDFVAIANKFAPLSYEKRD